MDVLDDSLMATQRYRDGLLQMVDQNDRKHEDAHKRIREDLRELIAQHENLLAASQQLRDRTISNENRIGELGKTMESLANRPVDITKLRLTPALAATIIIAFLGLAGTFWGSTYGLRSDVRDSNTKMDAMRDAMKADRELQALQSSAQGKAIDDMKRRQELFQYEFQSFKEQMMNGRRK